MPRTILTLIIGTAGGWLANTAGLPSAWLLGAMCLVLLSALAKVPVSMPAYTTSAISVLLGISIAASVDRDLPGHLQQWSVSLTLMLVMLGVLLAILFRFYRFRCRWQASDALLSSVPGNLAIVLAFAVESGLNVRRIALVHSVRLFFLVTLLPMLVPVQERGVADTSLSVEFSPVLALVLVVAIGSAWLAQRLRVPAGALVGALFGTLALRFGAGVEVVIPELWYRAVLVVLGTALAVRMNGLDLALLRTTVKGALGGFTLALVVSAVFALVLHIAFAVPLLQALLAYMPGGIEVMVAIAFSSGVDPVFVATHQIARVLVMCLALPPLYRWLQRVENPAPL